MVESVVEGTNGLVWFHGALGWAGNHFLVFVLLFTLLACQECGLPQIWRRLAVVSNCSVDLRPLEGEGDGYLAHPSAT